MAELSTAPGQRAKLVGARTLVTADMVARLESTIDDVSSRFDAPAEFVVPGQSVVAAALDLARTVVRRAERRALAVAVEGSNVVPYLNRLSDLLWMLARGQENGPLPARTTRPEQEHP